MQRFELSKSKTRFGIIALLAATLLAGCGGGTLIASNANSGNTDNEDGPPSASDDSSKLLHVSNVCEAGSLETCSFDWKASDSVPLQAKLINGKSEPIRDAVVRFKVTNGGKFGSLASKTATTNEEGIASVDLRTANREGSINVEASVETGDVNPLNWVAKVKTSNRGRLRVKVQYKGAYKKKVDLPDVGKAEVSLFSGSKNCKKLRTQYAKRRKSNFSRSQLPTSLATKKTKLGSKNEGTASFVQRISPGKSYTARVKIFRKKKKSSEPTVEIASGCAKTKSKVKPGGKTKLTVAAQDHMPIFHDSYQLTHRLDLTETLPNDTTKWVKRIGLLVVSPGAFLAGCEPGDTKKGPNGNQIQLCPNGKIKGFLQVLLDSSAAKSVIPSGVRSAVDKFLKLGFARDLIRDKVDAAVLPTLNSRPAAAATRRLSDYLITALERFGFRGPMKFGNLPSPTTKSGHPTLNMKEKHTQQRWTKYAYYWKPNCKKGSDFESCRSSWIQMDKPGKGSFAATMGGIQDLHVEPHEMTVDMGEIFFGILERGVLPRFFSSSGGGTLIKDVDTQSPKGVVTLNELLAGLLVNCASIADRIGDGDGTVDGALEPVAETACKKVRTSATSKFTSLVKKELGLDRVDFTLSSPKGEPCRLHQPEVYTKSDPRNSLPTFRHFGAEKNRCKWSMELNKKNKNPKSIAGKFYSPRN